MAIGVVRAIDFLTNGNNKHPAIHTRQVKSSSIPFQNIANQSCATWGLTVFGYLAPEYSMHNRINVYTFSVVLTEFVFRRKPMGSGGPQVKEKLIILG